MKGICVIILSYLCLSTNLGISQSLYDAPLELISDQFSFTEGPAMDKDGNVYFTDQPNNHIWKYDTDGKLNLFMENAGRSNGLYIDNQGNIIACADEDNQLWQISMDRQVKKLSENFGDTLYNGPNDAWVSPSDVIYFTDPYYQRNYWTRRSQEMATQGLYVYRDGSVTRLDADFKQPNGIIGSADGKLLYVADIKANKTYRYDIQHDGSLANKTLFVEQGSDGMTLDEQGNPYLTGKGVTIYGKSGTKVGHIPVPANWTANVSFWGAERDHLFITASDKIFTLKMNVKGQAR